ITTNNVNISGFSIQNGWNGIVLDNSDGNRLFNNIINSNMEDGIYLEYSDHNVISNNSLSRNKLSPYIAPNFKGNIHLFHSNYNNISENEAIWASKGIGGGYGSGILLEFSTSNRILHNEFSLNEGTGIYLRNFGGGSYDYNVIIGNNASFNNGTGIELLNSQGNMISNNTANSNEMCGILLWGHNVGKQDNIVVGNTVDLNELDGIDVWDAGNNKIARNIIRSNRRDGMRLVWSNYNNITENLVSYNDCGIRTRYDTYDNLVYHNNFVSNRIQADCMEQQQRSWDDGYPSGGNYWSDYTDVDLYSGPYQNETGSDGIWDHPYEIDSYPLVEPWSPKPPSPQEALEELIETIETSDLPKGTQNSLKAKLKVAIHMLDMGKENGAIRKLTAFINRVEMLGEKTLTNEQADYLISEAQRIIDFIEG
ncbi:MAG: nitrous oxide reductase family maturation protein NosD, partial [Candidatus Hodarchaeota archaeon]